LLGIVQYVAGFLLLTSLNAKGYNVLAISVPSWKEFSRMVNLAGPVLLTMLSKVMARLFLHLVLLSVLFLSSEI
jgi:Na+-driven multidrug efflux pump